MDDCKLPFATLAWLEVVRGDSVPKRSVCLGHKPVSSQRAECKLMKMENLLEQKQINAAVIIDTRVRERRKFKQIKDLFLFRLQ